MQARDVMTPDPVVCASTDTVRDAARQMRDHHIGDVLVTHDGALCGIVTDRDIVVKAVAESDGAMSTPLGDICGHAVHSVAPDTSVKDVIRLMEDQAIRRVPVVEDSKPVGIISIGDLAVERDPKSALGEISAAPPSGT